MSQGNDKHIIDEIGQYAFPDAWNIEYLNPMSKEEMQFYIENLPHIICHTQELTIEEIKERYGTGK